MADPKQPNILDSIISGDPIGMNSVPAPLLPAISPESTPTGPTLGTESQLQAPASAVQPEAAGGGSWSSDNKTLTLPEKTKENSSGPLSPEEHVGILKTIGRLAGGMTGLTDPNSSPQAALGSRIGGLVGRAGGALAVAAGTPEQKQIAEEHNQLPMKMAQIQNEREYRQGVLGNKTVESGIHQQNADTKGQTADIAQQNADSNEELRGAHAAQIQAMMNGKVHIPKALAHAAGRDDKAETDMSALEAQQQIFNPIKQKGFKIQDMGPEGTWAVSPVTGEKIQLSPGSASQGRSNGMLLRTQIPITDAQGNVHGTWNPQTQTFTPIAQAHTAPGGGESVQDAMGGTVVPPKPTQAILTQGQMASNILPEITRIKGEITALGDKVGAAPGRWNEFWVNKGGIDDPDFAKADQDLTFLSSAMAKAHFGGSPPEGIADGLKKNFGLAQSPADLMSRIDAANTWMEGYASHVGGTPASKKSTSALNSSTPQSSGKEVSLSAAMALPINKGKSEDDVRKDITAHGHKVGK